MTAECGSVKKLTVYSLLFLLFLAWIPARSVQAWQTLTDNLDIECTQPRDSQLDCEYRLLILEPPLNIVAAADKTLLDISKRKNYPWPGAKTVVLFVIDTSDPARENVVENNIKHTKMLLNEIPESYEVGLATFDKDLRIEAPVGAPMSNILAALTNIHAVGKTTELYRSMLRAISILKTIQANRKAIFLFSDGQAEDKAYFHQDVVRAARLNHVIINGLGYPRSVSLSVALQTLRRLSEETGGVYVESDAEYNLPKAFLDSPYENLNTGGEFSIDLTKLAKGNTSEKNITITLETDIGDINATVPVSFARTQAPGRVIAAAPAAVPRNEPATQTPEIRVITQEPQAEEINLWLWYGIPIALVVLIVMVLIILISTFQQKGTKLPASPAAATSNFKPYAYLVVQDEKGTRYPITNTTWRIGRTRDNELALQDKSVSRRHAEIHRYSNGTFIIFDVDSLNGVYVNDEKIKKKKLEEGDIVEIGDIIMRFTLFSSDYQSDEDTAIQNTRTPSIN